MIFLDMDGPFADFHAGYRAISGGEDPPPMNARSKKEETAMWDKIHSTENFFRTLPVVEGAVEFYHWLVEKYLPEFGGDHGFLTACPPSKYMEVAIQKKGWVLETLFPYTPLVLPASGSKSKPAFIQEEGDILIDDSPDNCQEWEAAGGIAIQFNGDWNAVKERLYELA